MSVNSKWKQILGKKWTYPAIYMLAAALILALIWQLQDPNEYQITQDELGLEEVQLNLTSRPPLPDDVLADKLGEAILVGTITEQMLWPVKDRSNVEIYMGFFDETASEEELQDAIVTFQGELWPHTGIDIMAIDGKVFDVVATLTGEVIRAEKDPIIGYVVELQHENGLVSSYSSLSNLKVAKGDKVFQGSVLGLASRNLFEQDHGVHLHYEVRLNGEVIRPDILFEQDLAMVLEQLEQN